MQNRFKNIFITGGGGYVGSKLATDLVNGARRRISQSFDEEIQFQRIVQELQNEF